MPSDFSHSRPRIVGLSTAQASHSREMQISGVALAANPTAGAA
jgi:hypothetical protein